MEYVGLLAVEILVLYLVSRRIHLAFGGLFYRITKRKNFTVYLMAVLFLPGTFLHEMAHFLTALFLLVPVGQMELMPEVEDKGIKMGSVPVGQTDFVRRTLIGFAPVFFGIGGIFAILYIVISKELFGNPLVDALVLYLIFAISNSMFLSSKDTEGSWRFLLVFVPIVVALYVLGVRITLPTEFLQKVDLFLGVPIIIDLAIILLLKAIKSNK